MNLDDFYKGNEFIDELEELPELNPEVEKIMDLRYSLVSLFTDYFYLSKYYKELSTILSEEILRDIYTVKINKTTALDNKTKVFLDYDNNRKGKILIMKKKVLI